MRVKESVVTGGGVQWVQKTYKYMCVCVGGKEGRRFNKSNKLRSIILKLNQNKTIGGGQTHGDTGSLFLFSFFLISPRALK